MLSFDFTRLAPRAPASSMDPHSARSSRWPRRLWQVGLLALALGLTGCKSNAAASTEAAPSAEPRADKVEGRSVSEAESGPQLAASTDGGVGMGKGVVPEGDERASVDAPEGDGPSDDETVADAPPNDDLDVAAPPKDDDEDEEDPEARKDYWEKIPFTEANFEEVREYVKTYYIEGEIDEARAYIEAASFALAELDPPREFMPVSFYDARKADPKEEGALDGKTYQLSKDDPYLLLIPKEMDEAKLKERAKTRLSDDEIRQKREEFDARRVALEKDWDKISFGQKEFELVMQHIKDELKEPSYPSRAKEEGAKAEGAKEDEKGKGKGKTKEKKAPADPMKMFYVAAAQGYLYSLDPHSSLVSAEAWEESTKQTTDNSFEGIGAILTQRNDETIVESPLDGRPAATAGVRSGDKIVKVDDVEVTGLPLHKVVKRIRGPRGTTVTLTVLREGEPDEKVFKIQRAHIEQKNVSGRLLEPHHPGIGYIKVNGFVPDTAEDIEAMFKKLNADNAALHDGAPLRGLVFDLRNNSGGLLAQGVQVADLFLESGSIVEVRSRTKREEAYRAHADGTLEIPLIMLVNDGSASASEIVASAIQDNARGLIVGDRTFGKASVQTLFTPILRKDYYIKLTIARYFAPLGRTLQVTGVEPDFVVPPDVGGKMPLGFREENLSHFLKPIDEGYKKPKQATADKVAACADVSGVAEKIHANDPKPAVKFDYQLMRAADLMECFVEVTTPSGAAQK
ncbi:MAG: S41 family peptidase [Myxococcales bacterium]|nr:S41 family peptidase [Myxococcales bacterium]